MLSYLLTVVALYTAEGTKSAWDVRLNLVFNQLDLLVDDVVFAKVYIASHFDLVDHFCDEVAL